MVYLYSQPLQVNLYRMYSIKSVILVRGRKEAVFVKTNHIDSSYVYVVCGKLPGIIVLDLHSNIHTSAYTFATFDIWTIRS